MDAIAARASVLTFPPRNVVRAAANWGSLFAVPNRSISARVSRAAGVTRGVDGRVDGWIDEVRRMNIRVRGTGFEAACRKGVIQGYAVETTYQPVVIAIQTGEFRYAFGMPRAPKPGGAVFEPRSLADNRKKFGHTISLLLPHEVRTPHEGAAELQHAIANRIREYLLDKNTDLKSFCENTELAPGLTYERFQRINRGETMMTLTDLMFWATVSPEVPEFVVRVVRKRSDAGDDEVTRRARPSQPGRR